MKGACFSRPGWWQTLCGRDAAHLYISGWTSTTRAVKCPQCRTRIKKREHLKRKANQVLFQGAAK